MKIIRVMLKNVISRYKNSGFIPHCINCKDPIKVGDKYIKEKSFQGAKKIIYCVPCARILNINFKELEK